jgi:hypothetical protein
MPAARSLVFSASSRWGLTGVAKARLLKAMSAVRTAVVDITGVLANSHKTAAYLSADRAKRRSLHPQSDKKRPAEGHGDDHGRQDG